PSSATSISDENSFVDSSSLSVPQHDPNSSLMRFPLRGRGRLLMGLPTTRPPRLVAQPLPLPSFRITPPRPASRPWRSPPQSCLPYRRPARGDGRSHHCTGP